MVGFKQVEKKLRRRRRKKLKKLRAVTPDKIRRVRIAQDEAVKAFFKTDGIRLTTKVKRRRRR